MTERKTSRRSIHDGGEKRERESDEGEETSVVPMTQRDATPQKKKEGVRKILRPRIFGSGNINFGINMCLG